MIPRPVSGWPNRADSEATIRSHASASSHPPPRHQPETAATWCSQRADRVPLTYAALGQHLHRRRVRHLFDVGAGREDPLVPGHDDAAHVWVCVEFLERADELVHELSRESVQLLLLRRRFPLMTAPPSDDICYATQNRQEVVKQIAPDCDLVIVVGSKNSSNSVRLVEVALDAGARTSYLVDDASEIDEQWLTGVAASASPVAPRCPTTW